MSGEALYERYKDALRRGHVAALRGRVDEALLAYAEAAQIAPERSTPHASAGTALLRNKRPSEALEHYAVALSMAPRDEAALQGRAQALAALGRRGAAADAFDTLAEAQAGSGHLADAVDAARRGLELAEGRERRRTLERLIERLRSGNPGEPGRLALDRALRVLDGPAVPRAAAVPPGPEGSAEAAPGAETGPGSPEAGVRPGARDVSAAPAAPAAADAAQAPTPAADGAPEVAAPGPEPAAAEPASGPLPTPPIPRELPAGATAAGLAARAEAAADAGVPQPAVDALLDLAALLARDGRVEAALDACYAAASFDPGNVALHLALADLYSGLGWDVLADEKLDLLERLARLDGDERALADIAGARAQRA